jgi:hypothetical protein
LKILAQFGISQHAAAGWINHVKDRPFNDTRYAVDSRKLRSLGWEQKTSFDDGLTLTVQWYRKFGKSWWGDIESILTPFPEVRDGGVYDEHDPLKPPATPNLEAQQSEKFLGVAPVNVGAVIARVHTGGGGSKKRVYELEGKENLDLVEANKRVALDGELSNGNREVVR